MIKERKQAFLLGNQKAQNKTISLYIITTKLGTPTGLGKIPGVKLGTGTFICRVLLILILKVGITKSL